jgi:hypothetical protein
MDVMSVAPLEIEIETFDRHTADDTRCVQRVVSAIEGGH